MGKLPSDLFREFWEALLDAFPSYGELEQMVRFHLNENLAEVAGGQTLRDVVFHLLLWAESNENIQKLIQGARKANFGNPALLGVEEKLKSLADAEPTLSYEREETENHDLPAINSQENKTDGSLENILSKEKIESLSLILDFSSSYIGTRCNILTWSIYLVPSLQNIVQSSEKKYSHLDIYIPFHELDFIDHLSEKDEIFLCGLVGYIANRTKIKRFSVEKFGVIPAVLKNFVNLEELRILDCKNIKSLPWDIIHLSYLQQIVIQGTDLDVLPSSLFELPHLLHLDLSSNQLRFVPPAIGHLTNLVSLALLNNPLEHLPKEINQLKNLQALYVDDRLKDSVQIQKRIVRNYLHTETKENIETSRSQFQDTLNWIFISFPKIIGRLFFDIFGQHEPADLSTMIIGYLIILGIILAIGLTGIIILLVVLGWLNPGIFFVIIEKILQLFFGK